MPTLNTVDYPSAQDAGPRRVYLVLVAGVLIAIVAPSVGVEPQDVVDPFLAVLSNRWLAISFAVVFGVALTVSVGRLLLRKLRSQKEPAPSDLELAWFLIRAPLMVAVALLLAAALGGFLASVIGLAAGQELLNRVVPACVAVVLVQVALSVVGLLVSELVRLVTRIAAATMKRASR